MMTDSYINKKNIASKKYYFFSVRMYMETENISKIAKSQKNAKLFEFHGQSPSVLAFFIAFM